MESSNITNREQLLATWANSDEVTIIRSVVSQGKHHIDACIDYLAQKKQLTPAAYNQQFQNIVKDYVMELLQVHHLIKRAADVLRHVGRDVTVFFYQFAKQCSDEHLCTIVLEYLETEYPTIYPRILKSLQFHWDVMEQLKNSDVNQLNLHETNNFPEDDNLENFMTMDIKRKQPLIMELYLSRGDDKYLEHIDKITLWKHLITFRRLPELTRWCWQSLRPKAAQRLEDIATSRKEDLSFSYQMWPIDDEMYQYGVQHLGDVKNDALRNCFAAAGYFFPEESVEQQLQRITKTNSFDKNISQVANMSLGAHILALKKDYLLLKNIVPVTELEELAENKPEDRNRLQLVICLKKNNLHNVDGFRKIVKQVTEYLNSDQAPPSLITFFNLLTNDMFTNERLSVISVFRILHIIKYCTNTDVFFEELFTSIGQDLIVLPTPYQLLQCFKGFHMDHFKKSKIAISSASSSEIGSYHQIKDLYHVKQYRSSYGIYYLITELLRHYTQISKRQLQMVCENVYNYVYEVINLAKNTELVDRMLLVHCITFCEMLGFDTRQLRCVIKLRLYQEKWVQMDATKPPWENILNLAEFTEHKILKSMKPNMCLTKDFPLDEYTAVMALNHCVWKSKEICGGEISTMKSASTILLQHYANMNCFWQFLFLIEYFDVPVAEVKKLIQHFKSNVLRDHFNRSLVTFAATEVESMENNKERKPVQKHLNMSVDNIDTSHFEKSPQGNISNLSISGRNYSTDLFALILLSSTTTKGAQIPGNSRSLENVYAIKQFIEMISNAKPNNAPTDNTVLNFLRNAFIYERPILAILAATTLGRNPTSATVQYCWLTWLLVTTQHWNDALIIMNSNPNNFIWRLIDELVRHNHVQNLLRSFLIFFPDNELVHLFRFMELTAHQSDFGTVACNEMQLYCTALVKNRVSMPLLTTSYQQDEFISKSIGLLLSHLQYNFNGMLDQHKCLTCLGESDWKNITDEVDFCLLEDFHELLLENIGCHHRLDEDNLCLQINFTRVLESNGEQEFERLLNAALEAEEYMMAIEMASLLQKPVGGLVHQKWLRSFAKLLCSIPDMTMKSFQPIFKMIDECEMETTLQSLPPAQLVNFLLYTRTQVMPDSYAVHYIFLQRILEIIKQHRLFTNETFDRNEIEYDMITCYLRIQDVQELSSLPMYYSEYFEDIMSTERKVLYKSYPELVELAGTKSMSLRRHFILDERHVARLMALIHRLLDEGDIVGAMHLQELFSMRSMEMRLLMYCMSLAENITTLENMKPEDRQVITEIRQIHAKHQTFHRQMIAPQRVGSVSGDDFDRMSVQQEKQSVLDILKSIAANIKHGAAIANRVVSVYRIAMYMDKDYLDILRTKDINILLDSLGKDNCQQPLVIVNDILSSNRVSEQEISELLAYEITCAIVKPRFYILQQEQQNTNAMLWGYNIDRDIHTLFDIQVNCSKLGFEILKYCDALVSYRQYQDKKSYRSDKHFETILKIFTRFSTPMQPNALESFPLLNRAMQAISAQILPQIVSHRKQNVMYVELLIKAHQCFVHDCCMEGIANVLNRTKVLNHTLSLTKSWPLLVRMLTGIGRYREMHYCFETLIANDQFESLLGQFDEVDAMALRQGILEYLKEHCYPANQGKELFKMAAAHFLMYKDLAEMWREEATALLEKMIEENRKFADRLTSMDVMEKDKLQIPKLYVGVDMKSSLQRALDSFVHAAENYLLDHKVLLAEEMATKAELVAMQIDLASKADIDNTSVAESNVQYVCYRVVCLKDTDTEIFQYLANNHLNVFQACILSRNYKYTIQWSEALLHQFVIQGQRSYLNEFRQLKDLNDDLVENIVKSYQSMYAIQIRPPSSTPPLPRSSPQMKSNEIEDRLLELLEMVKSVVLKYRLASLLSKKKMVLRLLNEHTIHYLRDTNFGCVENGRGII